MTAIQENERLSFGSARLFGTDASGNRLLYPELNDISIDFKTDLKEAYGEQSYPFSIADSHKSIDISAKHYLLDQNGLAFTLGGAAPDATQTTGYAVDETGVIDASAGTYALANTTPLVLESVIVGVTTGGVTNPTYFVQTSGSAVAGVSYSLSGHTLTFATGDKGEVIKVTYSYTAGSPLGTNVKVTGGFQNSQPFFSLVVLRRDASRVDGSTGYLAYEFARCRDGGIKIPYKEGDYAIYERTFKAFADPMGNVLNVRAFNA